MHTLNSSVSTEKSLEILSQTKVLEKDFTVYGTAEEPLFLAKDVAAMIDYTKTGNGDFDVSSMLKTVDLDEKVQCNTTNIFRSKGNPNKWFLTENGLYEVLMQSTKPIAKSFKKQVKKILHDLRTGKTVIAERSVVDEFAHIEARVEAAKMLREMAAEYCGQSKTYKQVIDAHASKVLTGTFVIPLPEVEEIGKSAGQIGEKYGLSSQKTGAIIKKHGIQKTEETGVYRVNKAKGSNREVDTFYYNEKTVKEIEKAIESELNNNETKKVS